MHGCFAGNHKSRYLRTFHCLSRLLIRILGWWKKRRKTWINCLKENLQSLFLFLIANIQTQVLLHLRSANARNVINYLHCWCSWACCLRGAWRPILCLGWWCLLWKTPASGYQLDSRPYRLHHGENCVGTKNKIIVSHSGRAITKMKIICTRTEVHSIVLSSSNSFMQWCIFKTQHRIVEVLTWHRCGPAMQKSFCC